MCLLPHSNVYTCWHTAGICVSSAISNSNIVVFQNYKMHLFKCLPLLSISLPSFQLYQQCDRRISKSAFQWWINSAEQCFLKVYIFLNERAQQKPYRLTPSLHSLLQQCQKKMLSGHMNLFTFWGGFTSLSKDIRAGVPAYSFGFNLWKSCTRNYRHCLPPQKICSKFHVLSTLKQYSSSFFKCNSCITKGWVDIRSAFTLSSILTIWQSSAIMPTPASVNYSWKWGSLSLPVPSHMAAVPSSRHFSCHWLHLT